LEQWAYISGSVPSPHRAAIFVLAGLAVPGEACLPGALISADRTQLNPQTSCACLIPSITISPATPNRKRGKSMSFRSGQSGNVVRKGQMWHGRFYLDVPGDEARRRTSVPIGSIHSMKKTEAKRKLRAMIEEMGLNADQHLERALLGGRTFTMEAAWWREQKLSKYKPSCQETMGGHVIPH
jgi:hypothetical protein